MAASASILVVGAGPVGCALSQGLLAAGYTVRNWARSAGPLWNSPAEQQAAEIVILAVRDEAIAQAAAFLLEQGAAGASSVLLHCAGALPPLEALGTAAGRVRGRGLLHPLRSFVRGAAADLAGTVMAVSGDAAGLATARSLCQALFGVPLEVSPEQQAAYHAAAVMAAGHVAALLDVAGHVLSRIGLHRRTAEQALAALTRSVACNVESVGLPAALTGPFARGDAGTVARHLQALSALSAEAEAVYRGLAPSALDLGHRKGAAPAEALDRIAALLVQRPASSASKDRTEP